ncbi:hypothetical protein TVAG_480210 [Trichomonas vaginalis G3]|uniref:Uncharacterized protein n=1 Tax=Trichomonas vaginalis (strain ATCC PRA-98 / G3) TaxID=412133 RepID=A2FK31_TRIV3|nr:UDP-glucose:glycoprotein glucosyltransferase family [Trichomonas vaginalis G3]EAX94740.1 hypothetical protein TVAG_480210 [Trichomonas vaginalis G3]KAI5551722.1 UDP-glucose:glycoprotein glucosyltransferase family [Trichomonas vaginalis G3]|eukprot:XP_001307670.1 hypothetical protein [Trichomonas vaginalis G3]
MFSYLFTLSFSQFLNHAQIKGDIVAPWNKTSIIAETLSFLQDIDHSLYWDYLEQIQQLKKQPKTIDDVLSTMKDFLDYEQFQLLNISLQIHYYSPRVQNNRALGEDSRGSNVRCNNAIIQNIDELPECNSEFFEYEPVYGSGKSKYILYADVDSNDWINLYTNLLSKDSQLKFVLRAYGHSTEQMVLSGYGAQLKPFKYSMEFKVGDQRKKIKATTKAKPAKTFEDIGLKVNLNDVKRSKKTRISTQIIKFIKESKDPLKAISELTQNYPVLLPQLKNITATEDDAKQIQRMVQFIGPGATALFVNGRKLTGYDLNAFTVYQTLLDEYNFHTTLKRVFDVNEESLNNYERAGHTPKPAQQAIIDLRHPDFLYWVNDLEKDEKYVEKYSKSLITFVSDSENWPQVARNVANVIFLLDPAETEDMDVIAFIDDLVEVQYPVRFGYIIVPKHNSAMSKKIYYAYAHLAQKYGIHVAHKFLLRVNDQRSYLDEKTRKRGPIKSSFWKTAFSAVATQRSSPSFDKMTDFYKPSSAESIFLSRLKKHISRVGVSAPAIILNGMIVEAPHPETYLNSFLKEELKQVRELMGNQKIYEDTVDIHNAILKARNAMLRFNPLVQKTRNEFTETLDIGRQNANNQRIFAKWMTEIKYQHGSSFNVKNQTSWLFLNTDDEQCLNELEMYTAEIMNKESSRISVFKKDELPNEIIQNIIGIPPNKITVVFNGRIVRFDPDQFTRYDLQLLEMCEQSYSTSFAMKYLKLSQNSRSLGQSRTHRELSDSLLYMLLHVSHLAHNNMLHTGSPISAFEPGPLNVFRSKLKQNTELSIYASIDPFSFDGQRLASLSSLLGNLSFSFIVNPPPSIEKEHLESLSCFYRFSTDSKGFSFEYMNSSTTYSLVDDVPSSWQTIRTVSNFDIDNIVADDFEKGTHKVRFDLKSLVVEGCESDKNGRIVPAVEYSLYNSKNEFVDETRVIQSNGYWQLMAVPGMYRVRTNADDEFKVVVDSFIHKFEFRESKPDPYVATNRSKIDDGKIHIFYVASGHLYERLMRISILSVVKHTKSPVKLWLLENFASPNFRNSLKEFSEKYKFEYEFCSYKWPRWLPREEARQRTFWGYKILFLDVMFPNDLRRVIYIDSDQIIRTDMRELMTMDFEGKPYAFTPFCNDRPEMQEYRFWEIGYWQNLLNGKPYHISALFAVDLPEYRSLDVGGMMRKGYMDLHNDKESLSNLDQDLPNMMQNRGAPIFSLPQEWLWCGSWCSDETMKKAKTIDLCNNPRTKVGKLEYAKETIPEWIPYDEEANGVFSKEL